MRGGAANPVVKQVVKPVVKPAAKPVAKPAAKTADETCKPTFKHFCSAPGDPTLMSIGIPYKKYLTELPYIQNQAIGLGQGYVRDLFNGYNYPAFSDHAPIVYDLHDAPLSVKNNRITIITWNVGQYGNILINKIPDSPTYNHKFNMRELETLENYKLRLTNIVSAMRRLLDYRQERASRDKKYVIGSNDPFLFCQELPHLYGGGIDPDQLNTYFIRELRHAGLGILRDSSQLNEFGLISKIGSTSQKFTVLNKNEYSNLKYPDTSKSFIFSSKINKEWRRFEIYFYDFQDRTYYYVNVHAIYYDNYEYLLVFLNKIIDVIHVYRQKKLKTTIKNVTIYFIGDYNFNIADPLVSARNLSVFFGKAGSSLKRNILSVYKFTARDNIKHPSSSVDYGNRNGYSLSDNYGNRNYCNVDCMLKVVLQYK